MPTKPLIQVDMFEVQLGAAVLLQFRDGKGKCVRVLADAGVKAGGYKKEHVSKKLPAALDRFAKGDRHIDLIIGTHYDEDHLIGLVPVLEDKGFTFGEAWMPPVRDDDDEPARRGSPEGARLLVDRLQEADGVAFLKDYLRKKAERCRELMELEHGTDGMRGGTAVRRSSALNITGAKPRARAGDDLLTELRGHIADANDTLGTEGNGHADADPVREFQSAPQRMMGARRGDPVVMRGDRTGEAHSLALVRKSEARKAINAAALADVVFALKKRKVDIHSELVPDGTPRAFAWDGKRFAPGTAAAKSTPGFTLLGPSEGLSRKHEELLPISEVKFRSEFAPIGIKGITPSNQLSYIGVFTHADQNLLISGDAGCVDFMTRRSGPYHPALLKALRKPLHVVQVAHHGGNNAHFYRVLQDASYAEQKGDSFLLLSHAVDDKTRPSTEFGTFMANMAERKGMRLLFTSRPTASKVKAYKKTIAPVKGKSGDVGDVRLSFTTGKWAVESHAIKVG